MPAEILRVSVQYQALLVPRPPGLAQAQALVVLPLLLALLLMPAAYAAVQPALHAHLVVVIMMPVRVQAVLVPLAQTAPVALAVAAVLPMAHHAGQKQKVAIAKACQIVLVVVTVILWKTGFLSAAIQLAPRMTNQYMTWSAVQAHLAREAFRQMLQAATALCRPPIPRIPR
jgi:hypothetical protein